MKYQIHEANFIGEPLPGTGETLTGATGLDIVTGMQQNPFQAGLTPHEYMSDVLTRIKQAEPLPEDQEAAATRFLAILADGGFVTRLED